MSAPTPVRSRRDRLPPRLLPVLYFGCAHAALLTAFALTALEPRAIAGFFYHDRMAALVHLVTLGWISLSILGALYIVGPMALRMPMPAGPLDYGIWAMLVIGIIGMASHFWIGEYGGMAWSAGLAATSFTLMAVLVLRRLRPVPLARPVKLHIALAFLNVLGAATMGVLLAIDKVHHFLPGYVLTNVFAHAHLAAIGWACLLVVGMSYRLLPMVLPAAMPEGPGLYASAVLLETGAVGLFCALLAESRLTVLFGLVTIAGFGAFFRQVLWMRRHPRPAPAGRPQPDYGVRHVTAAFVYLALACITGLALAISPPSDWMLRAALLYGIFALIGFLAQIIVGIQARILPIFAWYHAFAGTDFQGPVDPPNAMTWPALQEKAFYLWLFGVPSLAGGFCFDAIPFLAAGAWMLLAATVLNAMHDALILRHAWRKGRPSQNPPFPSRVVT